MSTERGNRVLVVGAARTPIGAFRGALSTLPATALGSIVIGEAIRRAGIDDRSAIQEVYLGMITQAGAGQAPARQAALGAGLSESTPCTTVNKVCASGMKAIMMAAQSLRCRDQDLMVAGGMESMSRAPFLLDRQEIPYGGTTIRDSIVADTLTDVYNQFHMGCCAENTARKVGISREEQDQYALEAYRRAQAAMDSGLLAEEIVAVEVKQRRGPPIIVSIDEEPGKLKADKVASLKPAFEKDGTVTAANASKLNDGAAACVLINDALAKKMGLNPMAELVGWADAAVAPIDFPLAPVDAVRKLLARQRISADDIAMWEINEAFSAVALACIKELGLDAAKVNVNGGAVSLGHPVGMSGARITNHLCYRLKKGELGVGAICNGGGGASAILVRKL